MITPQDNDLLYCNRRDFVKIGVLGLAEEYRWWLAPLEQQNTGWTAFSLKITGDGQELMGRMLQVMLMMPYYVLYVKKQDWLEAAITNVN